MLKIRLQRTGRKNRPFYRVVVAEHSAPIKGRYIDHLGFYNPLVKPWSFEVDAEKVSEWIKKGAKPSNTVARLLKATGAKDMETYIVEMTDRKKKNEEEVKEEKVETPAEEKKEEEPVKEEAPEEAKEEEVKEEAPAEEKKEEEPVKEESPEETKEEAAEESDSEDSEGVKTDEPAPDQPEDEVKDGEENK